MAFWCAVMGRTEAITAVTTPAARLQLDPTMTVADQCVANIPDANKMVNVARSYWLRGIPETSTAASAGKSWPTGIGATGW